MNVTIRNKRYPAAKFVPGKDNDCLQLKDEKTYLFEDCVVDAECLDGQEMDEALGVTWGSSATFNRCVFRNAKKLVLIGSGNQEKRYIEEGKTVYFNDCIFSCFGRRGPEIQSGMRVYMDNCLIEDWGYPGYWDTRAFGIRVHDGAQLHIKNCIFVQDVKPSLNFRIKDKLHHWCQAIKDHGLMAIFKSRTYASGWKRACTVEGDAVLVAEHCWSFPEDLIIDNHTGKMRESIAKIRLNDLRCIKNQTISKAKGA